MKIKRKIKIGDYIVGLAGYWKIYYNKKINRLVHKLPPLKYKKLKYRIRTFYNEIMRLNKKEKKIRKNVKSLIKKLNSKR